MRMQAKLTRRQILKGIAGIGLSTGLLSTLLTACARAEKALLPSPTRGPSLVTSATPTMRPGSATTVPPVIKAAAGTPAFQMSTPAPATSVRAAVGSATPSPTPAATSSSTLAATASPIARSPGFELTERQKVAHLLRRAGFGFNADELDLYESMGVSSAIDGLVEFQSVDDSALDLRIAQAGLDFELPSELRRWWYLRMAHTRRPLQEKMTLFWHGILTSSLKVVRTPVMMQQNILLRTHGMGSYQTLLEKIGRDPAMLVWLDSRVNRKQAPNENYARELMELFTLSPGYYSEDDVRESARAFTGWGLKKNRFEFRDHHHDYGTKRFLGETGAFDGDDIVRIILSQRQAARFISKKLWEFFVYDDPEPDVVERLANVFVSSGYVIKDVVRAMFKSPEFFSGRAYRTKIKSPIEFVVQTNKALNIDNQGKGVADMAGRMGHSLFAPPDVAGWPGGAAWIDSSALIWRVNFANLAAMRLKQPGYSRQQLVDVLLDGTPDAGLETILDEFELSTRGSNEFGVKCGMLYLLLAGPAFQWG